MNKKIIIPCALGALILIIILYNIISPSNRIYIEVSHQSEAVLPDSIELKVYMENSGSMDAYMCNGSTLKDAVYDYISDLSKEATSTDLYYINTQIITIQRTLDDYILHLTPQSFKNAGGNRNDTDLRQMFKQMLSEQQDNVVSIFVSDCILDIPQNATDFFGNCQISVKNSFNEALQKNSSLSVQILKMSSKFRGMWSCGKNYEVLDTVRPYYIWAIGDNKILAKFNKKVPVHDIYKGINERCSYVPEIPISYNIPNTHFVKNRAGIINVQVLANLSETLQSEDIIGNVAQYTISNPSQVEIKSILPVKVSDSKFSHIINLQITNPETLKTVDIAFNYPYLTSWVEPSNDDTGKDVKDNIDKTTGIKYLITGVAEAYKNYTACCHITFDLNNKQKH